jgi:pimeloyl-ACP methyl ester carboxylesterase
MKFLVQQQPAFVYTGRSDLNREFDAAKPAIVFIHGAANDHSVWTLQARYFAHHGFNVLAVDLPGHGKSFGEAKTSIAQYADWVINLLDNGAIKQAALVGHSMGSLIALDIAARYPSRVSQLALLGCGIPMPVSDVLLDAAKNNPAAAFDMLNIWGHAPKAKWAQSPTPGTSIMMAYKRLLEKSRPGVLAMDLAACHTFSMDENALNNIAAPTVILSGTRDMMTPPKANAMAAKMIANARLVTIENSGHAMMQEAPGEVLNILKNRLCVTVKSAL